MKYRLRSRAARSRQAGDTIIEVMICIGVIGAILAGAFLTTQRAQAGVRDSQEHTEALKLVEGQLEQIRANASNTRTVFNQSSAPFCMYNREPVSVTGSTAADCKVSSAGAPTTQQPQYRLQLTRDSVANVFTVKVDWDSVNSGTATESIVYRMYP